MLSANKERLQSFLNNSSQYVIPFFQRSYVWTADNWSELWDNIMEEFNVMVHENKQDSEHFIGTIIVKQLLSEQIGENQYELIDGQQRMTTICLMLKAFQDLTQEQSAKDWIGQLLKFKDSYGNEKIKIIHSKVDREYFENIILSADNNLALYTPYENITLDELEKRITNLNRIQGAYLYFRNKVSNEADLTKVRLYINIIIEKLPVIHMALNANDDVQQIFDTINSLGVKLTTAELLKNYLYAEKSLQLYYPEYWNSVFEEDEDDVVFWNTDKNSGRVKRTVIELYLYSYLVIKKESNVKLETLFKEFKNYLKDKNTDEKIAFAKDIYEYALVYRQIPDNENLSELSYTVADKRFFHLIRELDVNTIFPLILFIYKEVSNLTERENMITVLESYIARRTICKLTTKNYNNLFISLLSFLKSSEQINATTLKNKLLEYTEDTNRFPDETELKAAFDEKHLINKYSREILYIIALKQLQHDYTDNQKLSFDGFSVEHIMPKNWERNWKRLPEGITKDYRNHKLLTLGNLTLLKGKLNSALRDAAWADKRKKIKPYATIKQTVDYLGEEQWDEAQIINRSNDLYQVAVAIWQH